VLPGAKVLVAALTVTVRPTLDIVFLQPIPSGEVLFARLTQPMAVRIRLVEIEADACPKMLVTTLAVGVPSGAVDEMCRERFGAFEVHVAGTAYVVSSRVPSVLIQGLCGIEDDEAAVAVFMAV